MTQTVLLVDDDPSVRAILGEVLRTAGFAILEAADGTDALRIVKTALRPIEILVTDINMPGIDGLELARRVQALRPTTGVLCMSGAPADVVAAWGLATGTVFLRKPFGAAVFLDRVRDLMRRVQVGERAGAASPSKMPVGARLISTLAPDVRPRAAVDDGHRQVKPLWAIVLAGGEGRRLRPLTRYACSDDRLKPFAALLGGRSLLRQTLDRIRRRILSSGTAVVAHVRDAESSRRAVPAVGRRGDDMG